MGNSTGRDDINIPTENCNISVPLVGDTQIVDVLADGITTKALLDSGSQVSTVAEWFFKKYLQSSDLISVDEILDLRQVSRPPLQYIGIMAVDQNFLSLKTTNHFQLHSTSEYRKTLMFLS